MNLRPNKALRSLGIYKLRDEKLILLKRSEDLSFLFTFESWNLHGPVEYRVSHGDIYYRGHSTGLIDEDLIDTGMTANQPCGPRYRWKSAENEVLALLRRPEKGSESE